MIDHLGLQCADPAGSAAFYRDVFAVLGVREVMRFPVPEGLVVGLATDGGASIPLWFSPLVDPGTRPVHLALAAPSREAVDEVFAAAVQRGAEVLHEPRLWPEYHPGYYGAFFRDPDGNNVEAVHHSQG